MNYVSLKANLDKFYRSSCSEKSKTFQKLVYEKMDDFDAKNPGLSSYKLKSALYDCISENAEPIFFDGLPFFCEMGITPAYGDGCYNRGGKQANGWLIERNSHIPIDADPETWKVVSANLRENLYIMIGPYSDLEHFGIPMRKLFAGGLKSIMSECESALALCENEVERDFVECAISGIKALKRMQDKFAAVARSAELTRIAEAAARVPWEAPSSVYEGLCVFAFIRKAMCALEGVGFNTFGRVDLLLGKLYESDIARGVSDAEIYDDVCRFMTLWDAHLDYSTIMSGYGDYEYENSLVIGGCDMNGEVVFNRITEMIVESQSELNYIYPKVMCRYSASSPEEYLSLINRPTLKGQSVFLYENDDVMIPATLRKGVSLEEARDYHITGCWGAYLNDIGKMNCSYVNILKTLEWTINQPKEKLAANALDFKPIDGAESFDEVFETVVDNFLTLLNKKAEYFSVGARYWHEFNPVCIYSALTQNCLKNRRDFTNGGAGIPFEQFCLSGYTDVVDSLLAIKRLCFDEKICTLGELLDTVRANWSDERLRAEALRSPHHGDGTPESIEVASRLIDEVYERSRELPTSFGGEYSMAIFMYTELLWWGKTTKATPNGRRDGEYLSHGLTPSRLHEIKSVTDVVRSVGGLDMRKCASNSILNVVLPATKIPPETLNAFLRASAGAGVQALQINVVNREELLAAQREPERYRHIVVRVCGFSAPFVALSPEWQKEFLTRNYYEG